MRRHRAGPYNRHRASRPFCTPPCPAAIEMGGVRRVQCRDAILPPLRRRPQAGCRSDNVRNQRRRSPHSCRQLVTPLTTRRTGIARPRRRRRFSPMSRAGPPGQRSMQPLPRSIQRAPGHVLNMWFPRGLRALRVEHEHGLFETQHVVSERFLSFGLEEAEAGAGGVGDAGDSPEAAVGGLGDDGTAEGTKSGDGGFDVIDLPEDRPLRRLFGGQ